MCSSDLEPQVGVGLEVPQPLERRLFVVRDRRVRVFAEKVVFRVAFLFKCHSPVGHGCGSTGQGKNGRFRRGNPNRPAASEASAVGPSGQRSGPRSRNAVGVAPARAGDTVADVTDAIHAHLTLILVAVILLLASLCSLRIQTRSA